MQLVAKTSDIFAKLPDVYHHHAQSSRVISTSQYECDLTLTGADRRCGVILTLNMVNCEPLNDDPLIASKISDVYWLGSYERTGNREIFQTWNNRAAQGITAMTIRVKVAGDVERYLPLILRRGVTRGLTDAAL